MQEGQGERGIGGGGDKIVDFLSSSQLTLFKFSPKRNRSSVVYVTFVLAQILPPDGVDRKAAKRQRKRERREERKKQQEAGQTATGKTDSGDTKYVFSAPIIVLVVIWKVFHLCSG